MEMAKKGGISGGGGLDGASGRSWYLALLFILAKSILFIFIPLQLARPSADELWQFF